MKRLIYCIIALALILSLFGLTVFADGTENVPTEDIVTEETPENGAQPPENSCEGSENDIIGEIIAVVTNGEIWAVFGTVASGVLALIIAVTTNSKKITGFFQVMTEHIAGKATKEETRAAMTEVVGAVQSSFDDKYAELSKKYDELEAHYNSQTAVLTLVALQLVKSPNARTEIMKLLQGAEVSANNVVEVVENIQEEIKKADAAEPKPDTPALDAIVEETRAEAVSEPAIPVMILS